jgi:preprotein translocase SecF subunit
MYDIIKHRRWYYIFSTLVIVPGILIMLYSVLTIGTPFRLSIDYTGGTMWELRFSQPIAPGDMVEFFHSQGISDANVHTIGDENTLVIRTKQIGPDEKLNLMSAMEQQFGERPEELQFRAVGPTVGKEVTRTAFIAVIMASLVILGFIIWAFRQVDHPVRYGVSAIIAMIHDVLVASAFFSLMGFIAGWEVDALFLTALLTVIGFSVQDTIVVFDRIRENSRRRKGESFEVIANRSLLETMQRSIATQINAMFVMIALLLFGGVTIRQFIATMFIGMLSGTYSSIFIATPLLVSWNNGEGIFGWFHRDKKKQAKKTVAA